MTPQEAPAASSFKDSVRLLFATLVSMLQTRLELLCTELEEERERMVELLIFGLAALVFISLGVILLTFFIAVIFWETHRLEAIGGCTLFYFLLGGLAAWKAKQNLDNRPRFLDATLSELEKDHQRIRESE